MDLILADYYEEKYLIKKAQRLRRKSSLVIYGFNYQYKKHLGLILIYTYPHEQGSGYWFSYGKGHGYNYGNGCFFDNGSYYR